MNRLLYLFMIIRINIRSEQTDFNKFESMSYDQLNKKQKELLKDLKHNHYNVKEVKDTYSKSKRKLELSHLHEVQGDRDVLLNMQRFHESSLKKISNWIKKAKKHLKILLNEIHEVEVSLDKLKVELEQYEKNCDNKKISMTKKNICQKEMTLNQKNNEKNSLISNLERKNNEYNTLFKRYETKFNEEKEKIKEKSIISEEKYIKNMNELEDKYQISLEKLNNKMISIQKYLNSIQSLIKLKS